MKKAMTMNKERKGGGNRGERRGRWRRRRREGKKKETKASVQSCNSRYVNVEMASVKAKNVWWRCGVVCGGKIEVR